MSPGRRCRVHELGNRRGRACRDPSRKFTPAWYAGCRPSGRHAAVLGRAGKDQHPARSGRSAISAGAAASWASRPAPAVRSPRRAATPASAASPSRPQSSTWLLARHAAVDAGAREARHVGRVHPVVDALAGRRVLAGGDRRLQVHDPGAGRKAPAGPPARRPTDSRSRARGRSARTRVRPARHRRRRYAPRPRTDEAPRDAAAPGRCRGRS